jgi:hypothetical protein
MGASIQIDPISHKRLNKRFKALSKAYPEEMFKAIVAILFDIKLIAQKKIKSDGHIVTSRLRNSIFVKTPKQRYARRSTNSLSYTFDGGSGNRDLSVNLETNEGAVGTNVEYAHKIENLDSYLEFGAKTVDVNKRFRKAAGIAEKKAKK